MSKIILTGCAGFVGSYIQDELIKQGHQVTGIDSLVGGFKQNINPKCNFIKAELGHLNQELLDDIISDIKPKILVHCAASAHEGGSFFDPVVITKNNLMAYMSVLESCIKAGSLKFVNCFGSMAQYGEGKPPFKETDSLDAVDPYAVNKNAMECITKQLAECHGFKYSWTIPHNVMGPRQSLIDPFRNVAGIMMNRIMNNEKLYIYGDGEQTRQFSTIQDALPCFMKMIDPKFHGERINIGGTETITVNKLVELTIDEFKGYYTIPKVVHLPDRHGEVRHAFCNPSKSVKLLGYKDEHGIGQGIKDMSAWAMKQGAQKWKKGTLAIKSNKWPKSWKLHDGGRQL